MGMVFDIRSFCVDDGDGVRTAVFLKGCPLACLWCHNPEGQSPAPEISFTASACIDCGACREVCRHPDGCAGCGACADVCVGARRLIGKEMTADEVIARVSLDRAMGGGMTLTGGEPLYQMEFCLDIARLAVRSGISVDVETSGYGSARALKALAESTDCFLFDIKESDEKRHLADTGVPLAPILSNLDLLASLRADIVLRCPIIPGFNDREDHFAFIASLANRYPTVRRVDVLPYHSAGRSKYARLGRSYALSDLKEPDARTTADWTSQIQTMTRTPVANGSR